MQRIEAREGRPLDELLRDLYVDQGLLLSEIGERFGLGESAVSRWLAHFDIPTRRGGPVRSTEVVA